MRRMFGMMPSSEVQKECSFKDQHNYRITVQAGANGWGVLWADGSADGKDVVATVDENFNAGLAFVQSKGFTLVPVERLGSER